MPILSARKRKALKPVSILARYCFFGNYAAAEKLFNEVSGEFNVDGNWGVGVMLAVKGMIMAGREGDKSTFYWRCINADLKELKEIRDGLAKDLSRDTISDLESGFLNAWIVIVDEFIKIVRERSSRK